MSVRISQNVMSMCELVSVCACELACACVYVWVCVCVYVSEKYMFPYMVGTAWKRNADLLVLGGYDGGVRSLFGLVSLLPSFPLGLVFIAGVVLACRVCVCVWVCVWW